MAGRNFSDEDDRIILAMRGEGKTYREISLHLFPVRSEQAVWSRVQSLAARGIRSLSDYTPEAARGPVIARPETGNKPCICCKKPMKSTWAGERMCPNCRQAAARASSAFA